MPRDAWLFDHADIQGGQMFVRTLGRWGEETFDAIAQAESILHIDCAADGLERRPATPVFTGRDITLQSVRMCQQVFSAAFIGHIEAAYDGEVLKNELCTPVPHPDTPLDYLRATLGNLLNGGRWAQDAELQAWLGKARLDFLSAPDADGEVDGELAQRLAVGAEAAVAKLE